MRARCVVDRVALELLLLRLLLFSPASIIPLLLCTLFHLHVAFNGRTNEEGVRICGNTVLCGRSAVAIGSVVTAVPLPVTGC